MRVDDIIQELLLVLPMLLLIEGIIAVIVWFAAGSRGGTGARVAAWLGLVTLTLWCGSAIAFVGLHVTVFMVLMPFGWALVVRHRGRVASASAGSPS
jgi:hypothetical protein